MRGNGPSPAPPALWLLTPRFNVAKSTIHPESHSDGVLAPAIPAKQGFSRSNGVLPQQVMTQTSCFSFESQMRLPCPVRGKSIPKGVALV
jgi:hypothetical protein